MKNTEITTIMLIRTGETYWFSNAEGLFCGALDDITAVMHESGLNFQTIDSMINEVNDDQEVDTE